MSIKTKIPYIIALFTTTMCINLLYHGFLITDILICTILSTFVVLKPNALLWMIKTQPNDTYNFMNALPMYIMFSGILIIAYTMINYLGIASLDNRTTLSIVLLLVLSIIIIDKSRYL